MSLIFSLEMSTPLFPPPHNHKLCTLAIFSKLCCYNALLQLLTQYYHLAFCFREQNFKGVCKMLLSYSVVVSVYIYVHVPNVNITQLYYMLVKAINILISASKW